MPSPFEEFTAGIRAGLSTLDESRQAARAAREQIQQARARLGDAAHGTERLNASLAVLEQVASMLERTDAVAGAADEEMRSYLVDVGAPAGPGDSSTSERHSRDPETLPDPEVVPEFAHDIIAGLDYPEMEKPAVGAACTWDGERFGEQLYSGSKGPAGTAGGVRTDLPGAPHLWDSVRTHVEAHLATLMRHPSAPKHVVLFIDRPPCPKKFGCAKNLQHLVPKGSTVTIYVALKDGMVEPWGRVTGTGRMLKQ